MILPIIAYGDPILRKIAKSIDSEHPNLDILIGNMFETMYHAHGIGLAAPQIGLSIRLFIIDTSTFKDHDGKKVPAVKKVFINPTILEEHGEAWSFNEGCLSIPLITEEVNRKSQVKITYLDETWTEHIDVFDGIVGRVIQHEYDHIQGTLFIDHLSNLKKTLLKNKLESISKGEVKVDYKMAFPFQKKKKRASL